MSRITICGQLKDLLSDNLPEYGLFDKDRGE